ncbi:hypothetical protein BGZ60DRAFT_432980 [Tricladium varicosporioides]|nr:hypothetical protein BGZ60DRAFT_432980 [Hymenoscyphus varicosporioides]
MGFMLITLLSAAVLPVMGAEVQKRWDTPSYCSANGALLSSILYPVSTTTALCPTPSSSMICNTPGLGNGNNLISYLEPLTSFDCHQKCLAMDTCKSFQIVNDNGQNRCNFFDAPAAGIIFEDKTGLSKFYDRDCADFLPAACTATPNSPTTTTSPPSYPTYGSIVARDQNSPIPFPTFLGLAVEALYVMCSCVVTSALPTTTITQSDILGLRKLIGLRKIKTGALYIRVFLLELVVCDSAEAITRPGME